MKTTTLINFTFFEPSPGCDKVAFPIILKSRYAVVKDLPGGDTSQLKGVFIIW